MTLMITFKRSTWINIGAKVSVKVVSLKLPKFTYLWRRYGKGRSTLLQKKLIIVCK